MSAEIKLMHASSPHKFGTCCDCPFFELQRDRGLKHQVVGQGICRKWGIDTDTVIGPITALENAVRPKIAKELLIYRQTCFEGALDQPKTSTLASKGNGKIPVNHFTMKTGLSFRQLNKHTR